MVPGSDLKPISRSRRFWTISTRSCNFQRVVARNINSLQHCVLKRYLTMTIQKFSSNINARSTLTAPNVSIEYTLRGYFDVTPKRVTNGHIVEFATVSIC